MGSNSPLRSPRVIKTEDRLCSFVQRILPPGLQFEMTNAFHDDVVIVAYRGSTWLSQTPSSNRKVNTKSLCVRWRKQWLLTSKP